MRLKLLARSTLLILLVAVLVGAACTGQSGEQAQPTQEIQLVVTPWSSTVPSTYIVKNILQESFDRQVELRDMKEGLAFQALANNDVHIWTDAWLPFSFADEWENWGAQLHDATVVYKDAPLGWIVPDYVDEPDSVAELKGFAEKFDRDGDGKGEIYGLSAGQDMNERTKAMIEKYELNYEVEASSEFAMITELETALKNEEPIITVAWSPHWIFGAYDIHFLKDPDQLFQRDNVHVLTSKPFAANNPQVTAFLEQVKIPIEDMNNMIQQIEQENRSPDEVATAWIKNNEEKVTTWVEDAREATNR